MAWVGAEWLCQNGDCPERDNFDDEARRNVPGVRATTDPVENIRRIREARRGGGDPTAREAAERAVADQSPVVQAAFRALLAGDQ